MTNNSSVLSDWEYTDWDQELFQRELDTFVPPKIFDAHAHLYDVRHFSDGTVPDFLKAGPAIASFEEYQSRIQQITPARTTTGLFFGYPHSNIDVDGENQFVSTECLRSAGSSAQMLVPTRMPVDQIEASVVSQKFVGLKCYHVWSTTQPTFHSRIEDFFPEQQAEVAGKLGLSVTLHIVRATALADVENQETIRRYCQTYPGMKLILAHAARGFNAHHTIAGIHALRGINNVWFDTSAITDCGAMEAIIRVMGHHRLLYGSDFPVSHLRGRCVALGDSFLWISATNTNLSVPYADLRLALVGHESLRAIKVAAMSTGLTDSQVEDIFCNNGAILFGDR